MSFYTQIMKRRRHLLPYSGIVLPYREGPGSNESQEDRQVEALLQLLRDMNRETIASMKKEFSGSSS
ncbi:MAG: hypothetical protein ACKO23_02280 [Gemmataceae bacterium]